MVFANSAVLVRINVWRLVIFILNFNNTLKNITNLRKDEIIICRLFPILVGRLKKFVKSIQEFITTASICELRYFIDCYSTYAPVL